MARKYGGRLTLTAPQHRLTVHPNEILERQPVLQALDQMDTGDPGFQGRKEQSAWLWENCPPLSPVPRGIEDYTGHRWGRLTVAGFMWIWDGDGERKKRWVCRCACGSYEARRARCVKAKRNPDEHCSRCNYHRNMLRIAKMNATSFPAGNNDGRWASDTTAHGSTGIPVDPDAALGDRQ